MQQVTAKFDIPGIAKEDMNVTYHPFPARLEVSWKTVKITERDVEDGMSVRDVEERTVCRTIPLPDGTRVSFPFCPSTSSLSHIEGGIPHSLTK